MERKVLFILIVTVLMNLSWAQNPRQLIRFGKRPYSSDRYRNQLAFAGFPQDTFKTRPGYGDADKTAQNADFHNQIRKWANEEDLQDLLEQ